MNLWFTLVVARNSRNGMYLLRDYQAISHLRLAGHLVHHIDDNGGKEGGQRFGNYYAGFALSL